MANGHTLPTMSSIAGHASPQPLQRHGTLPLQRLSVFRTSLPEATFPRQPSPPSHQPDTPPSQTEYTKLCLELNFSTTLCPASLDPITLTDDQIREFHRHAANRLRKADVTASGGLASSPAGMWKPLLQTSDGVRLFTHVCYLVATGRAPPVVTRTLATAELVALPRTDNRVRPHLHAPLPQKG